MRRILLSLCLLSGLLTSARADVVDFPPASCPRGSTPETCHGGPHCRVKLCQTDADCPKGKACKPVQACFGKISCMGRPLYTDASYPLTDIMKSACPSSGTCSDGQACPTENLCVSSGSDTTGTTTTDATSQQTGLTTSVSTSTGTTQDAGSIDTRLGDSGCSCNMGDWTNAKALGPWLLAALFSTMVTLLRRPRKSRRP